MKTTKLTHALWVAALAMLFGGCASDNELTSPADKDNGNSALLTFTAGTPDDGSAQTRVAYADVGEDGGKLTWHKGDQLIMAGYIGSTYKGLRYYTYQGESGETSGNFTGNSISGAEKYIAYYPPSVFVDGTGKVFYPSMHIQRQQSATDKTAHLRDYMMLQAEDITPGGSFTMKMKSSIMKFDLSGIPPEVGKLSSLIWTVDTEAGCRLLRLDFEDVIVDFGTGQSSLTAYLSFLTEEMSVKAGGKFSVILVGDKTYRAQVPIAGGKTYEEGKRYTATIDGGWTEEALMMFTVKLDNGLNLSMPFNDKPLPAETTVDWGDGRELSSATSGTSANFSHTYLSAGEYTVTVYSTETDDTKLQIPALSFQSIGTKLIRIETPLLNTGNTSFNSCFYSCSNLESIPPGLFDKNTNVTNFRYCFANCYSLTNIPKNLFAKNKAAKDFYFCFSTCRKLTLNPLIFGASPTNPKKEDTERFTGQTINFTACFAKAGISLGSNNNAGTAPALWTYTNHENFTSTDCFKDVNKNLLTNYDLIPSDWGGPATP